MSLEEALLPRVREEGPQRGGMQAGSRAEPWKVTLDVICIAKCWFFQY